MGKLSGMKSSLKALQVQVDKQRIAQTFGIDPSAETEAPQDRGAMVMQSLLERMVAMFEENQRLLALLIASKGGQDEEDSETDMAEGD